MGEVCSRISATCSARDDIGVANRVGLEELLKPDGSVEVREQAVHQPCELERGQGARQLREPAYVELKHCGVTGLRRRALHCGDHDVRDAGWQEVVQESLEALQLGVVEPPHAEARSLAVVGRRREPHLLMF